MQKEKTKQVTLTTNQTVRIPTAIVQSLGLELGTDFDVEVRNGDIILSPQVNVPRSQAYFWTKEWQDAERKAGKDIATGQVKSFGSAKNFIADLRNPKTA